MSGPSLAANPLLPTVTDLEWEIRATADLDGDRAGDLLWQHAPSGRIAAWLVAGSTVTATLPFTTLSGESAEPDLEWTIVGAADMNGDGQADILWRHATSGALRLWHMRGLVQWDSVELPWMVPDADWLISGLADMDGDGRSDILWLHCSDGRLAVWLMSDSLVRQTLVLSSRVGDHQWRLAGAADLDRDGHADLVWQHLTGGKLAVWYMNGLVPVRYGLVTPAAISDPNWRLVGVR
jgi:hypothetical protein